MRSAWQQRDKPTRSERSIATPAVDCLRGWSRFQGGGRLLSRRSSACMMGAAVQQSGESHSERRQQLRRQGGFASSEPGGAHNRLVVWGTVLEWRGGRKRGEIRSELICALCIVSPMSNVWLYACRCNLPECLRVPESAALCVTVRSESAVLPGGVSRGSRCARVYLLAAACVFSVSSSALGA